MDKLDYRKARKGFKNFSNTKFKLKKIKLKKVYKFETLLKNSDFIWCLFLNNFGEIVGDETRMKKKQFLENQETLYLFNKLIFLFFFSLKF